MGINVERALENNALLVARAFPERDHHGHRVVVVVGKLTWEVSPEGEAKLAHPPRALRTMGVHYGLAASSSLRFAGDVHCDKPGTDVILIGSAHPADDGATEREVSLRIETGRQTIHKALRVFGTRVYMDGPTGIVPGPAAPLTAPVPLRYELCALDREGRTNPAGVEPVVGAPAHRIERAGGSAPAGFGAIDTWWRPRSDFYGTIDQAYIRRRHPIAPRDFDTRFNRWAHPDLQSDEPLAGDEPVEIIGCTPEQVWRFRLPRYEPCFRVTMVDGEPEELPSHLDTFAIDIEDCDRRLVELTWRVTVRLPRKTEQLHKITITNRVDVDESVYDRLLEDLNAAE